MPDAPDSSHSVGTVIIAGLANIAVAAAKLVGGVLSGSSAMLSEAAHSLADTTTEVLLFVALRRGAKPADDRHPLGYGKAGFFWAFIASVCTFVAGAGFSVTHGIHTIRDGEQTGDYLLSFVILAVSFVIEGVSLTRAVRQLRAESGRWGIGIVRYLRQTPDTTVKAVTLEDSAALVGLVIAAAGLALTAITGSAVWDGTASILIGLLLVAIAATLASANVSLLLDQSLPAPLRRRIRQDLQAVTGVDQVGELFAIVLGRADVLIAAKIDFRDDLPGAEIEAACDTAERTLSARYPAVRYVFLDPTSTPSEKPS